LYDGWSCAENIDGFATRIPCAFVPACTPAALLQTHVAACDACAMPADPNEFTRDRIEAALDAPPLKGEHHVP
jgi:hypothetical protein